MTWFLIESLFFGGNFSLHFPFGRSSGLTLSYNSSVVTNREGWLIAGRNRCMIKSWGFPCQAAIEHGHLSFFMHKLQRLSIKGPNDVRPNDIIHKTDTIHAIHAIHICCIKSRKLLSSHCDLVRELLLAARRGGGFSAGLCGDQEFKC